MSAARKRNDESARPIQTAHQPRRTWLVLLLLTICCTACFFLRTWWLHEKIFVDGAVCLQDNDPWYHYRILEYQVRNLPRPMVFDPYAAWPDGGGVPVGPFFDLVPAAFIRLVGGSEPSQRLIDRTAAYFAPILAVGVCIAVFLVMSVLTDRWTGLAAALLIGVLPGAYFVRSALGFFDHHVMEVLLSTLLLYLLALGLRRSESSQGIRGVVLISAVAGVVFGCYMLTWIGGNYLLLIILAWLVVQHVMDHLWGRTTARLSIIVVPCLTVAAVILYFFPDVAATRTQASALIGGAVLSLLLTGLSNLLRASKTKPLWYPLAVVLLGMAGLMALKLAVPSLLHSILVDMGRLLPDMKSRTITEARPILHTSTGWSYGPLWSMFALSFPMAVLGLFPLFARCLRQRDAATCLLGVWSVVVLASMFGQSRFSYYAAPVVAMLIAYLCHSVVRFAWNYRRKVAHGKLLPPGRGRSAVCTMLPILLLALAIVPLREELRLAAAFYDGPTEDWREALKWLRENTPEPFVDPGAYYAYVPSHEALVTRFGVSQAYGVMSWWDYGYWISGIARRIPNSNPTQRGAVDSARFLLAQSESEAGALLDALATRYVMLDWLLPRWQKPGSTRVMGKFSALPVWLDQDLTSYYERIVTTDDHGRLVLRYFYYPRYFQSMCIRLFIFSGQAVRPAGPVKVYELQWREHPGHGVCKTVTAVREFADFAQAQSFVVSASAAADGAEYVLASLSPFESCVPLEPLRRFRLVHQSPRQVAVVQGHPLSTVRIFEYGEQEDGGR